MAANINAAGITINNSVVTDINPNVTKNIAITLVMKLEAVKASLLPYPLILKNKINHPTIKIPSINVWSVKAFTAITNSKISLE